MEVLEEYKKQIIQKYFKLVGASYKVQKKELYFKVFTRKKYNFWFLDMLDEFVKFFQNDISSILKRLEKIKGRNYSDYSFKLIKPSIKLNIFSERIDTKIKENCKFDKASVKNLSVVFNECFAYLNKLDKLRSENFGLVEKGLAKFTEELKQMSAKSQSE